MKNVFLAVWFALWASQASAADWITLTETLRHEVFRVEMQSASITGICSAVVFDIDKDGVAHALTAAHCVDHPPTEHFDITVDRRNAEAKIFNRIIDLAVVQFRPRAGTQNILLAHESPKSGSEIAVAGFAFGIEEIAFQFGHVAQTFNKETKALWADARIIFGDSGGATVDEQGHLIGLSTRLFQQQSANIGGVVPIEVIVDFIDAYKDQLRQEEKRH